MRSTPVQVGAEAQEGLPGVLTPQRKPGSEGRRGGKRGGRGRKARVCAHFTPREPGGREREGAVHTHEQWV